MCLWSLIQSASCSFSFACEAVDLDSLPVGAVAITVLPPTNIKMPRATAIQPRAELQALGGSPKISPKARHLLPPCVQTNAVGDMICLASSEWSSPCEYGPICRDWCK